MNVALSFYFSYRRGILDLDTLSFSDRFQIWGETLVSLPLNFRHSSTLLIAWPELPSLCMWALSDVLGSTQGKVAGTLVLYTNVPKT